MEPKNNGGTAFPLWSAREDFSGMTLRDYFAAKAMAVILQEADWESKNSTDANIAEDAYVMADAMLAARERK